MDDKDVTIAQLRQENSELRALVAQLRDEIARLKNQNSSNSSKPPSSDIVNPQPRVKRKKRKRGGQSGHRRFQRQLLPPEQVDETILHELPADEVQRRKLIPLDEYELSLQQIDLPKKLIHVTEHHVRVWKSRSGRPRWKNTLQTLKKVFLQKVRKPPDYGDAHTLAKRFRGRSGEQAYFLFLDVPDVEPTNTRTEQAIRFVVIDRRVTQGTRSDAGMRFCERAWTIIATCVRQSRSVYQFFLHAIKATLNPHLSYPSLIPVNP